MDGGRENEMNGGNAERNEGRRKRDKTELREYEVENKECAG